MNIPNCHKCKKPLIEVIQTHNSNINYYYVLKNEKFELADEMSDGFWDEPTCGNCDEELNEEETKWFHELSK